ncbi:MAG TPA: hypothetical protein VN240_06645 [Propylenella sp.]|nr:hypothetical protein [Propylenella sp.]
MAERISRDELRQLIREALREALGDAAPQHSSTRPQSPAGTPDRPASAPDKPARQGAFSLASGVLTEALVTKLASGHQKIVIAGDVVVTPLARDRARILKIEIVRQKP